MHQSITQIGLCAMLFAATAAWASAPAEDTELFNSIAALDAETFDAFNRCKDPLQLKKHETYFSPTVEFYHDTGGVTWTRNAMLANTRKYVCGNYRRELVAGTLRAYPIKDFGAIEQGVHRFCGIADGKCEGEADFTIVWQLSRGKWQITRVLSYGHRPAPAAAKSTE